MVTGLPAGASGLRGAALVWGLVVSGLAGCLEGGGAHGGGAVQQDVGVTGDGGSGEVRGATPARADAGTLDRPDAAVAPGPSSLGTAGPPLCGRPGDDAVRDVFCQAGRPAIASLDDLVKALESAGEMPPPETLPGFETVIPTMFLGHSTALSGHLVSSINPRALLLGSQAIVAFQRGVQRVEVIAPSRAETGRRLNFYLIGFRQACNGAAGGCTSGDLYTDRIERDWLEVSLQDDEDLKNTPADCRQCHQRGLAEPILLMRELRGPWTHFFSPPSSDELDPFPGATGGDLVEDYYAAKGDEAYASLPAMQVQQTFGLILENLVGPDQPLLFDSKAILNERWPYGENGYEDTPQRSPTWDRAYQGFKRGDNLALPYFAVRATDPEKLAAHTEAYQRYRRGELAADELPDMGDIFPDDPQTRAEIGLRVEPGATPAEVLVQACGTCHNDVLDQGISRARFNIDVGRMDRAELEVAMARLALPEDAPGAMPPAEARRVPAEQRQALIEYLEVEAWSPEELELLEHAAAAGMVGAAP